VNPRTLLRQYKNHSSDYKNWDQKSHAERWLLFTENIGAYLSIDEVSLSNGELWTFVTNKSGKGRKGTLLAAIRGTRVRDIVSVLNKIPLELRNTVQEVTMDMAKNMESAVVEVFTKAKIVTDRLRFAVLRIMLYNWPKEAFRKYVSIYGAGSWTLNPNEYTRPVRPEYATPQKNWKMVTHQSNCRHGAGTR
jgi:hypothetical protein